MKLKLLVFVGVLLLAATGTAAAKVAALSLTVDGPGMSATGVVSESRLLYRASSVLLLNGNRARTQPPVNPGPAYVLAYIFAVDDDDGSRTDTAHQTLYPFASGGPVVFTERRQKVDMTYGPVRFPSGWFKVPPLILRGLQQAGLPTMAPGPETVTSERTAARSEETRSGWLWLAGAGALVAGAGSSLQLLRRRSRRIRP